MAHGNKKYFFDRLKKGESFEIEGNNLYSAKYQAKVYLKENNLKTVEFKVEQKDLSTLLITRTA